MSSKKSKNFSSLSSSASFETAVAPASWSCTLGLVYKCLRRMVWENAGALCSLEHLSPCRHAPILK